jgi:hypothetical protein
VADLHHTHDHMIKRADKEVRLRQLACGIRLYGLSGAGKGPLARERCLFAEGFTTQLLNGDAALPKGREGPDGVAHPAGRPLNAALRPPPFPPRIHSIAA